MINGTTLVPTTFQQRQLWVPIQQHPKWRCNLPYVYRLSGPVMPELLSNAFAEVIRRHDALRTKIVVADGTMCQQVDSARDFQLEIVSFESSSRQEAEKAARRYVGEFFRYRFDVATDELLRVKLLKFGPTEHWLAVNIHHIVADGFSNHLLFNEVWGHYGAAARGQAVSLSKVPGQYSEYALWQQATDRTWMEKSAPYWEERLRGAQRIQLPTEKTGEAQRRAPVIVPIMFGKPLSNALREFARSTRTPLPVVLLTSYVEIVSRWCKQRDFVVAFNIAGRHRAQDAHTIGYFPQALHLRMQLRGDETYRSLLALAGQEFYCALDHQDFGRVALQHPSLAGAGFFQWNPWKPAQLSGFPSPEIAERLDISLEALEFPSEEDPRLEDVPDAVNFCIHLFDDEGGIYGFLGYRAELFTGPTMNRFARDLCVSAQRLVENPGGRIAE
jgi:hypothetical protein